MQFWHRNGNIIANAWIWEWKRGSFIYLFLQFTTKCKEKSHIRPNTCGSLERKIKKNLYKNAKLMHVWHHHLDILH